MINENQITMTKKEAVLMFKMDYIPSIKERERFGAYKDVPMRREAWHNFTDSLCKDGSITTSQYNRWQAPAICN